MNNHKIFKPIQIAGVENYTAAIDKNGDLYEAGNIEYVSKGAKFTKDETI